MDERCAFRCCGYHTASMLLNVDRYPLPDGAQPELKPLE
jgi:hypothetical protein